jgi:DnaJ-class molecular chaperone
MHDNNKDINNLYSILGIEKNASEDEIKKAYKKLVLRFHPDKNNDKNSHEQFIKIHSAYEILINNKLREDYDKLNKDKYNFRETMEYFYKKYKKNIYQNIYNILSFIYNKDNKTNLNDIEYDDQYKNYIDNNKFDEAFNYLMNKYIKNESELNIIDNVECDLINRYNNNYMLIEVIRKSRENIELYVPLRNEINIYYGEGEINDGKIGDLILHTKTKNNNGYYCKNKDMFKEIEIEIGIEKNDETINQMFYYHINGEKIRINENEIIDNKYIIFYGFGLPLTNINNERGDLICEIKYV